MKYAAFNAVCPFEIGDKILDQNSRHVHEITDIMCVHRLRAGTVTFRYELNYSGRYVEITPAKRQEERQRPAAITLTIGDESGQLPPGFLDFINKRFGE